MYIGVSTLTSVAAEFMPWQYSEGPFHRTMTVGWGRQAVPTPSSTESALPVTRLRGFWQNPVRCNTLHLNALPHWQRERLQSGRYLCVPSTMTASPCVGDEGGEYLCYVCTTCVVWQVARLQNECMNPLCTSESSQHFSGTCSACRPFAEPLQHRCALNSVWDVRWTASWKSRGVLGAEQYHEHLPRPDKSSCAN